MTAIDTAFHFGMSCQQKHSFLPKTIGSLRLQRWSQALCDLPDLINFYDAFARSFSDSVKVSDNSYRIILRSK